MNFELSIGRLHVHSCWGSGVDETEPVVVELQSQTQTIGFAPNGSWEDEEDDHLG